MEKGLKGGILIVRYLLIVIGMISLLIGLIGLVLPLLPTTPFVLLSAWLFSRSSKRFHHWLQTNRLTGPIIFNWEKNKTIPHRAKVTAIIMIFFSFFLSVAFVVTNIYLKLALAIFGLVLILYMSRIPSTNTKALGDS